MWKSIFLSLKAILKHTFLHQIVSLLLCCVDSCRTGGGAVSLHRGTAGLSMSSRGQRFVSSQLGEALKWGVDSCCGEKQLWWSREIGGSIGRGGRPSGSRLHGEDTGPESSTSSSGILPSACKQRVEAIWQGRGMINPFLQRVEIHCLIIQAELYKGLDYTNQQFSQ